MVRAAATLPRLCIACFVLDSGSYLFGPRTTLNFQRSMTNRVDALASAIEWQHVEFKPATASKGEAG
jgi:hypothetical protein